MRRSYMVALVLAGSVVMTRPASAAGTWTWPVVGPVIRGFDPPTSPYGSGHRGIDIAAAFGNTVLAPAAGVVSFAGPVGGQLFVSIDHGGGLVSTCSYLSAVLVRKGDAVTAGQPIGLSGAGHPGATTTPHLHFGVRLDGVYVDPMLYLGPIDVSGFIRLAPVDEEPPAGSGTLGWRGLASPIVSLGPSWFPRAPHPAAPPARGGPGRLVGPRGILRLGSAARFLV